MPLPAPFLHLTDRVTLRQSAHWQTNSGLLRGQNGYLLVDPGILKAELEEIADFVAPTGVCLGLSTHAHWDHLLWHPRFGLAVPRFASEATVARIQTSHVSLLDEMAAFERSCCSGEPQWQRDLLFHEQPLPPGNDVFDGIPCRLIPLPGHSTGQCGLYFPSEGVLFSADTLSDEEVPTLESSAEDIPPYLNSLDALEAQLTCVKYLVPGHGSVADPAGALQRLVADRAYLRRLEQLQPVELSGNLDELARRVLLDVHETRARTPAGWAMHRENIRLLSTASGA